MRASSRPSAIAALYPREGADIAIIYLLQDDDAAEIQRIVRAEGSKAITIYSDLGAKGFYDDEDIKR